MKDLYRKYLNNLAEGDILAKENLHSIQNDKEALLEQIRENSTRAYRLRTENEAILSRILYERKVEDLTERDVNDLMEFAGELFEFVYQSDSGIAYRIHQLLYEYAVLKGDLNLQYRQLYQMGTNLYYLNPQMPELSVNLFGKQITEYFNRGAGALEHLAEITDPDTQNFILRCVSNTYVSDEKTVCPHQPCTPYNVTDAYDAFEERFEQLMDIYCSEYYRKLCPDFPWEKAIYNLHINRSQTYLDPYIGKCPAHIMRAILESADYVYTHQEQLVNFSNNTVEAHTVYLYGTSRWLAGLISTTELADVFIKLIEAADPADYSDNGITLNLQMPTHLEYMHRRMEKEDYDRYEPRIRAIMDRSRQYLRHAPRNELSNVVTGAVSLDIRQRYQLKQPVDRQVFNSLLFCHPPTYIHVRVAAAISRIIFLHMAQTVPEKLVGLYGVHDPETIRRNADKIGSHIHRCCLYHDVGKIMFLEYISIYGRRLLDEEFSAIKLHPVIGAALLSHTEPQEMAVIAKYHHKFYNEQGGYPENAPPCPKEYKAIVDIVSVSDSIEAATDDIGRCYSFAKTFPQITDELRREAGTRYSPDVVALFDDESFSAEVEKVMMEERRAAYLAVYGKGGEAILDEDLFPEE